MVPKNRVTTNELNFSNSPEVAKSTPLAESSAQLLMKQTNLKMAQQEKIKTNRGKTLHSSTVYSAGSAELHPAQTSNK